MLDASNGVALLSSEPRGKRKLLRDRCWITNRMVQIEINSVGMIVGC